MKKHVIMAQVFHSFVKRRSSNKTRKDGKPFSFLFISSKSIKEKKDYQGKIKKRYQGIKKQRKPSQEASRRLKRAGIERIQEQKVIELFTTVVIPSDLSITGRPLLSARRKPVTSVTSLPLSGDDRRDGLYTADILSGPTRYEKGVGPCICAKWIDRNFVKR